MMKPPTTSAMTAKPIMSVSKNPQSCMCAAWASSASCDPVTASTSPPAASDTATSIAPATASGDAPGAIATTTLSCRPGSPRRA